MCVKQQKNANKKLKKFTSPALRWKFMEKIFCSKNRKISEI